MANENVIFSEMTREEFDALSAELERLKTVERNEVSEKIRVARGFGDLSENSEYDEAKNEQARLEASIAKLEEQLKHVNIVEYVSTDAVAIGTKVTLLDMEFEEETVYKMVSNASGNDDDNIITPDSPVGKAILGKKAGEVAEVMTPSKHSYSVKIVKISK